MINIVHGFGDVGAAVVEHDDVDGVFFTGSTATGKKIAEAAALARTCSSSVATDRSSSWPTPTSTQRSTVP